MPTFKALLYKGQGAGDEGAKIVFTLDGSDPRETLPAGTYESTAVSADVAYEIGAVDALTAGSIIRSPDTGTVLTVSDCNASGSARYQWQESADDETWSDIPDATSASYDTAGLALDQFIRRGSTDGLQGPVYTTSVQVGETVTAKVAVENVVFIGASLLSRPLDNIVAGTVSEERWNHVLSAFSSLGFKGALYNRAVGAARFSDTTSQLLGIVSDYKAQAATTLYVVHRSGNDVTDTRPWDGSQQSSFDTNLENIRSIIAAEGSPYAFANITKRLYGTDVPYDGTDTLGSLPFNTNSVNPFIAASNSDWYAGGAPVLDAYDWSDRRMVQVQDGTHFRAYAEHIFAEWLLWEVATKLATYTPLTFEDVTGKSILCSIMDIPGFDAVDGINYVPGANYHLRASDGTILPGAAVEQDDWSDINSVASRVESTTNIAVTDARLANDKMLVGYSYGVASGVDNTRRSTGVIRFRGFPAGATGISTWVASRSSTGVRRTNIAHGGTTVNLDGETTAASNQATLDFTVDANGEIVFSLAADAIGVGTGYTNAVILDFD